MTINHRILKKRNKLGDNLSSVIIWTFSSNAGDHANIKI